MAKIRNLTPQWLTPFHDSQSVFQPERETQHRTIAQDTQCTRFTRTTEVIAKLHWREGLRCAAIYVEKAIPFT